MATLITERDVRAVLGLPEATTDAIAAMERLFEEQAAQRLTLVPRIQLAHPDTDSTSTPERSLRVMPCIGLGLGAACVRIYTTKRIGQSIATPAEMLLLFDLQGMQLRAIIEDRSLHTLRTAAPTAVATKYLARPDARRIAVIGTGRHARGQLAAVASVCQVETVTVFGRDVERRERYCQELQQLLGATVQGSGSAEEAVSGADIVIVATATSEPALKGKWLEPGMHVNSIAPSELDAAVISRSRIFPAYTRQLTDGAPTWTPIPQLLARGRLRASDLETQLCDVVAGRSPGRESPDDITLFISSGMAGWDLAIALWIDRWARELALGTELYDSASEHLARDYVCFAPGRA